MRSVYWLPTTRNTSLAINKLFMMKILPRYVSSWSLPQEEIFWNRTRYTSKKEPNTKKIRYGRLWLIWQLAWSRYTIEKYCIGIWNVPMFLSLLMESSSWEISTYPKYSKKIWLWLRQELLTMQVLRSGKTSLTDWRVICGLWDVSYTKWQRWDLRSWHLIFKLFTKRFVLESSKEYLCSIQASWLTWYHLSWK